MPPLGPILSLHTWVSLPNEQRNRIRSIFNIPRSSFVVVNDGRLETDGTTNDDFLHLTVEKMRVYLGNDSKDFHKLFDMVVAKVTEDMLPKVTQPEVPTVMPIIIPTTIPVFKPKKNATKKQK